ncbi:MAG: hypothetical protein JKY92_02570 [Magnetovibrio sp.]|nr:hypothetical protein [Magnetovibrio sp.]
MFKLHVLFTFVVALVLVIALPALADMDKQDIAREAVLAGKVAPLSKLLSVVEQENQGEIIKIELEEEDARKWGGPRGNRIFIYEIKILTRAGELLKLKYDAKTLKLLATNRYGGNDRRSKDQHSDD